MKNTNDFLKQAAQLYREGNLTEALQTYQQALDATPDSIDILHAVGSIEAQLGNYDIALIHIDKALALDKATPNILNSKANILSHLEQYEEAAKLFNQAIKLDPRYAIAYNGLGKCLYLQNKLKLASKALEKAIELKPKYLDAKYNLALVLVQEKKWAEAIAELEPIVSSNPNFLPGLSQLGELYLRVGDYSKALKCLDVRAELDPDNAEANHSLAQALALSDDPEAAITYYEKALMQNPNHHEVNQNLANTLVKIGEHEKAINYYFRQITLEPLPETYFNIGVLLMYQERNKEALQYLEHAAKLNPNDSAIFLNLGAISLKLRQYERTIAYYKEALRIDPDNQETKYIIDALSDGDTPDRAPNEYLASLFNQYATYYDKHLTTFLEYNTPEQLQKIVVTQLNPHDKSLAILDLGCGTGLSGMAFERYAKTLTGIDVSDNMIEQAKEKSIYDDLIVADIEVELDQFHNLDLVIAADVFTYIGELKTIFEKTHAALTENGYFTFSVETTDSDTFELKKTLRFGHHKNYITTLAKDTNFTVIQLDNAVLRKQQKKPIEGYLVLLQKNYVWNIINIYSRWLCFYHPALDVEWQ